MQQIVHPIGVDAHRSTLWGRLDRVSSSRVASNCRSDVLLRVPRAYDEQSSLRTFTIGAHAPEYPRHSYCSRTPGARQPKQEVHHWRYGQDDAKGRDVASDER